MPRAQTFSTMRVGLLVLVVGALVAGCGADNANSFVDGLVRVPLV